MSFSGFPDAALDFYEDLEVDNTKSFWEAHKATYKESVEAPMKALLAELEPEFGTPKVFRPHRDVRFSKDKSPYKTHQGAFVASAPATGWYVELSAAGVRVGGGFYEATPSRLAALRAAIDNEHTGVELEKLIKKYERGGWEIGGETVKTSPRGYHSTHPRIALLRHKQLFVGKPYGFEGLNTPTLADKVRKDWRSLRPLIDYLSRADVLDA